MQGILALNFLSARFVIEDNVPVLEIQDTLLEKPSRPMPGVFDTAFFDILDKLYKKHLYDIREFFGLARSSQRDQETWKTAMKAYWEELAEEVESWTLSRQRDLDDLEDDKIDKDKIRDILKRFQCRLQLISAGVFNCTRFGMEFPTPAPLLCPTFLLDVSNSIITLKPWLNVMWYWLDPFAMHSSSIMYYHGATLSLRAAMGRFRPKEGPKRLLWKIMSEIFCMRSDALVSLRNADVAARTSPIIPNQNSLPNFDLKTPKEMHNLIHPVLKVWCSISCPELIQYKALQLQDILSSNQILDLPEGPAILNALTSTGPGVNRTKCLAA